MKLCEYLVPRVVLVLMLLATCGCLLTLIESTNIRCPNANCTQMSGFVCGMDLKSCRKFPNQCEFQIANCNASAGSGWLQTDQLHCHNFSLNETKGCACLELRACSNSSGPATISVVCVKGSRGCRLMKNACELTRAKCVGEAWSTVDNLQCKDFHPGDTKPCACPKLENCTLNTNNTANLCVQRPPIGGSNRTASNCKLMRTSCELERARCKGETWTNIDTLQCKGFMPGDSKACACPKLQNCSAAATGTGQGICVKGATCGCQLMRNECELERARCRGEIWSKIDGIQCHKFKPGDKGICVCPKLETCLSSGGSAAAVCVKGSNGCRLMPNACELERALCGGERWSKVDNLQCRGFNTSDVRTCACPKLDTCTTNGTSICVEGANGCKLLKNECDFERSICVGEGWLKTHPIQCKDFQVGAVKSCACPCLNNCSNTTRVCGISGNNCKNFKSECEMRQSSCQGEKWTLTNSNKCQGFKLGQSKECICPQARRCNPKRIVCVRRGSQCKKFTTDCEFKKALCKGEAWRLTNAAHCCQFSLGAMGNCTLTATKPICATINNKTCRNFKSVCELRKANGQANPRWRSISRASCKCIKSGQTADCSRRPTCRPPRRPVKVCARLGSEQRIFNSQCDLLRHNYNRCSNFKAMPMGDCQKPTKVSL